MWYCITFVLGITNARKITKMCIQYRECITDLLYDDYNMNHGSRLQACYALITFVNCMEINSEEGTVLSNTELSRKARID